MSRKKSLLRNIKSIKFNVEVSKLINYLLGTIFEIYEHYELIRTIGQGAYGIVCSAKNNKDNSFVAIKKVKLQD